MTTNEQPDKIEKPKSPKRRKQLPRWAKITIKISKYLIIPILCIFAIIGGMVIGYVTIGKQDFSDVFQFDTWRHLYDLVFKESVDP